MLYVGVGAVCARWEGDVTIVRHDDVEAEAPIWLPCEVGVRYVVTTQADERHLGVVVVVALVVVSLAQEECLCRVSTLYPCLADQKMRASFYTPHRKNGNTLHNDDIIYTPNVLVIKDDDHNLLSEPFSVDIISCAAPNLRERPSNQYNTGDRIRVQISDDELLALHEKRAKKIFAAAVANDVDALILGAFGCGAFKNNPRIVAQAYKNVLPLFVDYFQTIEFAIYCRPNDLENYNAFNSILV